MSTAKKRNTITRRSKQTPDISVKDLTLFEIIESCIDDSFTLIVRKPGKTPLCGLIDASELIPCPPEIIDRLEEIPTVSMQTNFLGRDNQEEEEEEEAK